MTSSTPLMPGGFSTEAFNQTHPCCPKSELEEKPPVETPIKEKERVKISELALLIFQTAKNCLAAAKDAQYLACKYYESETPRIVLGNMPTVARTNSYFFRNEQITKELCETIYKVFTPDLCLPIDHKFEIIKELVTNMHQLSDRIRQFMNKRSNEESFCFYDNEGAHYLILESIALETAEDILSLAMRIFAKNDPLFESNENVKQQIEICSREFSYYRAEMEDAIGADRSCQVEYLILKRSHLEPEKYSYRNIGVTETHFPVQKMYRSLKSYNLKLDEQRRAGI